MIKVAHEAPLALMEAVRNQTDYDYALVHLFEKEPKYLKFFQESLKMGRKVILDNSIFELSKSFDKYKYRDWITTLCPTEYIIPDVLENSQGTMDSAEDWHNTIIFNTAVPFIKKIGVVQGKTYEELVSCYAFLDCDLNVDKLAISFDYSYYLTVFPHPNKWVSYMMGRVMTLGRMFNEGVINKNKPHHLLGCAHPREFSFYAGPEFSWIETLDTSSPVVHGLKNIEYDDRIGTWTKETLKIADSFYVFPTQEQSLTVLTNIIKFKKFLV